MIKKFIKLSFVLLVIFPLLLVLLIKNPNSIGFFVDKFSHHKLEISNIDVSLQNNILTLTSELITLQNEHSITTAKQVDIVLDFSELYNPHNTIITQELDIHITKLPAKNNSSTKTHTSSGNNLEYLPLRLIDIKTLHLTYKDFSIQGNLHIQDSAGKQIITGVVEKVDVATTLQYLHLIPFKSVVDYLKASLKTGYASNVEYTIVSGDTITVDIRGKIHNGYINFYPGWDYIDNINADFVIDNNRMLIDFDYAKINALETNGKVNINWENELFIGVNAKTVSDTNTAIEFLKLSPLPQGLKTSLSQFQASGDVSAALHLHIPITSAHQKIQVVVNAALTNNTFSILEDKINADTINATLVFDEFLSINGTANIMGAQSDIEVEAKEYLDINIANTYGNARINNQNNLWNAHIHNNKITGDISLDLTQELPKVYLQDFFISRDTQSNNRHGTGDNSSINIAATEVPSFDLQTKNIKVNNKMLPNITGSFVHKTDGLHIKNLEFEGIKLKGENIKFNGLWVSNITSLYTTLSGEKLNDLFESFNIPEETSGGKFALDIRGSCLCKPWEMTTTNISGYGKAIVEKGSFTTQDNNIGKVLSLLNITSLAKRLSLEEDDISDGGFTYDSINAEVILNSGIATIENFKLLSDSSTIDLTGNSNIDLQSYNLNALVVPAIKDSIPIATALAGGGLAGLGVWLLDKILFKEELLESVIGTVTNFEYKITGDWDNPQIDKL